jgi:ankyrin repeat protein
VKIHEYALQGDIAGISTEIERGVPVDGRDAEGRTPLMVAATSGRATPETLRFLIGAGASVNALVMKSPTDNLEPIQSAELGVETSGRKKRHIPSSVHSVLTYAVKHASREKIDVLLDAGADVTYIDACGYSVLVRAVYRDFPESKEDFHRLVSRLIEAGAPLDAVSGYGESAMSVASNRGDFQLLKLLIDRGADPGPLVWNELFFAVAFDEVSKVKTLIDGRELLEGRDRWERTPFLVAVHAGSVEMAAFLLSEGSNPSAKGRCGRTALMVATAANDPGMLKWLIDRGADVEESDEFGSFPLMVAAQHGATDCVRELLEAGADAGRRDQDDRNAIGNTATPEIIDILVERGECLSDVGSDMRRQLVGHADTADFEFSNPKFRDHQHRVFGHHNPERMNNAFWDAMVRTRASAYSAACGFGQTECNRQPVWCFQRFGQSITKLSDGRFIEIGGEHEDFYDADFCIYNDVVVHHGDGTFDIFGYPESVFPPTDFHTATLVGEYVYIVGCLGYPRDRVPGFTPVCRLSINSLTIDPLNCTGDSPGWIYKHQAKLTDDGEIEVVGGEIQREDGPCPNERVYHLDISKREWKSA